MKNIRKVLVAILSIITILSLFSCGVYNTKKANSKNNENVYETTQAMTNTNYAGFSSANSKARVASNYIAEESFVEDGSGDRKIAKSVSLNAETKTFDDTIEWLKKYVSSFNGIIDNSYLDTGDKNSKNYNKSANFSVRIPANKLDSFLSKIGNNLNVTFKQENIVDVTDDYFDSESRLKSLKIEEENLNEMLKKAKSVDEMIKVEDKLSEVRSSIENLNRRIKSYDKQINYSRVDINITEVKDLTDTKVDKNDFSKEGLNKKLIKTYNDVILFLKQVAAYIFINIPWIILGIIVLIIQILLYMLLKSIFIKKANSDEDEDKAKDNETDKDINNTDDKDIKANDNGKKNKESRKKSKDSKKDKEELSDEEKFDKVLDEIGNVITDGSIPGGDGNSDVDVEFFNEE